VFVSDKQRFSVRLDVNIAFGQMFERKLLGMDIRAIRIELLDDKRRDVWALIKLNKVT